MWKRSIQPPPIIFKWQLAAISTKGSKEPSDVLSAGCVVFFFGVAIHPPFDFKTIINRLRVAVVRKKKDNYVPNVGFV